jgi:hypothetical protein
MTADASAAYQLRLGPQNAENAFDKELDNEMALPATIAIRFLERAQFKNSSSTRSTQSNRSDRHIDAWLERRQDTSVALTGDDLCTWTKSRSMDTACGPSKCAGPD